MKVTCIPHNIAMKYEGITGEDKKGYAKNVSFSADLLYPGDRKAFKCDVFGVDPAYRIGYIDVGIGVTFQPFPMLPWRPFRQFLFEATADGTDTLRWRDWSLPSVPETYPPKY